MGWRWGGRLPPRRRLTPPAVVADLGAEFRLPTQPLGESGLFVATARWGAGSAVRWHFEVDGARVGGGQTETYPIHPDSRARSDAPQGRLVARPPWRSRVFAGTVRNWSIYLPAETPARRR